jgi:hypothetical protein
MTAKIAAALHAVMEEVSYVQKTGKNTFHNYKYAGEADLLEKLRPAMLKHGLLLLPSVRAVTCDDHANYTVLMDYTLVHKDGDVWPVTIGAAGCGSDKSKTGTVGDKGVYKAITGANKYLLFKLFQIETGDDPEVTSPGEGVRPAPPLSRASVSSGKPAPPALNLKADQIPVVVKTLIKAIGMAEDADRLNTWSLDNDATLSFLKAKFPKDHETVLAAFWTKMDSFEEAPTALEKTMA